MNICCFSTRIHSGWLERVSTWKVTVIHSLESVGCLVLFGSSQLSKSNCQRSTWLPCASHMGYSVHTPNFWTSGDLVGTSALHVQLVRRTSQHWIVIWTLCQYSWVNIGSRNDLVSSGNKPSPEPMLMQVYVNIHGITKPQWVNCLHAVLIRRNKNMFANLQKLHHTRRPLLLYELGYFESIFTIINEISLSFLTNAMAQIIRMFPHGGQISTYLTYQIPKLHMIGEARSK